MSQQLTLIGKTKYVARQNETRITAANTNPIGMLTKAAMNDTRGDARPQRMAKLNCADLFQNAPLSNNKQSPHNAIIPGSHNAIIPGSSLVRTVSGIQPKSVGSSGVSTKNRQIKNNGKNLLLSDSGPTKAETMILPARYHPNLNETMDDPDSGCRFINSADLLSPKLSNVAAI